MTISATRQQRKALEKECAKWPKVLTEVPKADWPHQRYGQTRVLRSRDFLVQEFPGPTDDVLVRLSISLVKLLPNGRWDDGLTWDQLQAIKNECGYADMDAVEVYPAATDIVDVANMRHLWVMRHRIVFAWRRGIQPAVA